MRTEIYQISGGNLSATVLSDNLKELGANVKQLTKDKRSALHIAAENEDLSMVQFLVEECELDINAQDKKGLTPAHLAAEHNEETRVLEYLVDEARGQISLCSMM